MKLSRLLLGTLFLGSVVGCSKPKAFAVAEEWHTVGDVEKEKICASNKDNMNAMIGALQGWVKGATPQLETKSKDFAAAIAELKDKAEVEKLGKVIEKFNPDDEPCDKAKAKLSIDDLKAYADINEQIKKAVTPAATAFEAKTKELNVTFDMEKFRP